MTVEMESVEIRFSDGTTIRAKRFIGAFNDFETIKEGREDREDREVVKDSAEVVRVRIHGRSLLWD